MEDEAEVVVSAPPPGVVDTVVSVTKRAALVDVAVGDEVGAAVGDKVIAVGSGVGLAVGAFVSPTAVGAGEGAGVGDRVGLKVGAVVGVVGAGVGAGVYAQVTTSVASPMSDTVSPCRTIVYFSPAATATISSEQESVLWRQEGDAQSPVKRDRAVEKAGVLSQTDRVKTPAAGVVRVKKTAFDACTDRPPQGGKGAVPWGKRDVSTTSDASQSALYAESQVEPGPDVKVGLGVGSGVGSGVGVGAGVGDVVRSAGGQVRRTMPKPSSPSKPLWATMMCSPAVMDTGISDERRHGPSSGPSSLLPEHVGDPQLPLNATRIVSYAVVMSHVSKM